jgi:hypothetical protein
MGGQVLEETEYGKEIRGVCPSLQILWEKMYARLSFSEFQ